MHRKDGKLIKFDPFKYFDENCTKNDSFLAVILNKIIIEINNAPYTKISLSGLFKKFRPRYKRRYAKEV